MPAKTLERMHGLQESMNAQRKMNQNNQYDQKDKTALFITDVYFKTDSLQSMDDLSLLLENIMSDNDDMIDIEGKPIYSVYNVSDLFNSVSWMIRELEKVADMLLMVAIAIFAVIIVLTNILFMHHRKTELGIYMSLGSRKSSIVLQIVGEVLLLALLSFTPAALASKYLADPVSDYLINNIISAKSDTHTTDESGNTINKVVLINEEQLQEMYHITADAKTVTRVFLLEIAVTAVSALVMIVYTVRISPREVLLRS
jgi:putative ABC transport system permease protein